VDRAWNGGRRLAECIVGCRGRISPLDQLARATRSTNSHSGPEMDTRFLIVVSAGVLETISRTETSRSSCPAIDLTESRPRHYKHYMKVTSYVYMYIRCSKPARESPVDRHTILVTNGFGARRFDCAYNQLIVNGFSFNEIVLCNGSSRRLLKRVGWLRDLLSQNPRAGTVAALFGI
jgi:hypothetical protein